MTVLATSLTTGTLPASPGQPLPTYNSNWVYLNAGAGSADLLAINPQGMQSGATTTAIAPVAYWAGGPATWPADQWAQCTVSSATGSYYLGVTLRASGTQCLVFGIRPTGAVIQAGYWTTYGLASATPLAIFSGQSTTLSTAIAAGDMFRFGVQGTGTSMVITIERTIAGGPFVPISPMFSGATQAGSHAVTAGRPGVYAAQAGALWGIRDWQAGDFVTGPLPPTPPTSPQGAFTVRTT